MKEKNIDIPTSQPAPKTSVSALYAAAAQLSMAPLNVPVIWRGQEPAFAVAVKSATSLPQALCAYGLLSLLDAASDLNISATNN